MNNNNNQVFTTTTLPTNTQPQQPTYSNVPQQPTYSNVPQQPTYNNIPQQPTYNNIPQPQPTYYAPQPNNDDTIKNLRREITNLKKLVFHLCRNQGLPVTDNGKSYSIALTNTQSDGKVYNIARIFVPKQG